MDQLVGAAEIAHDWRRRHPGFPEPVAHLKAALIWDWEDVEAWARQTGRLPSKPQRRDLGP